jgi:serine/threonine-protein kinase
MGTDLAALALVRIGAVLNKKYRLERLIGSGGMASVFEAVHRNGHRVAIKMLYPHLYVQSELRERFLREGYLANKVNHASAVRVLDDDVAEDGAVFLVMELLYGETLDARCKRAGGRLPHRDVCGLSYQLLDALAAAHDAGIVHRDIKPENLFFTQQGVLKVLDFGIARLRDHGSLQGQTAAGRVMGTPAFMAPEQALGKSDDVDGQTDVYGAGATMFNLSSGQYVHDANTVEELLVHAGSRTARSILTVLPDLPHAIARVIDRALAFRKDQRWATARGMQAALGEACRVTYGSLPPGARPSDPPPGWVSAPSAVPATIDDAVPPRSEPRTAGMPCVPPSDTEQATAWPAQHPATPNASTTGGMGSEQIGRPTKRRLGGWLALGGAVVLVAVGGRLFSRSPTVPSAPPAAAALVAPTVDPLRSGDTADRLAASTPLASSALSVAPTLDAAPAITPSSVTRPVPKRPDVARPKPTQAPPTDTCDPPFYVDAQGHRRYKPDCLQ